MPVLVRVTGNIIYIRHNHSHKSMLKVYADDREPEESVNGERRPFGALGPSGGWKRNCTSVRLPSLLTRSWSCHIKYLLMFGQIRFSRVSSLRKHHAGLLCKIPWKQRKCFSYCKACCSKKDSWLYLLAQRSTRLSNSNLIQSFHTV